jgi:hypothetical protein
MATHHILLKTLVLLKETEVVASLILMLALSREKGMSQVVKFNVT